MKSSQSANRSFYAISQIGAPSPFTAVNHIATNGRWINFAVRAYRSWFSAAETRRFGSKFRRCQFRKTVSAQCTSMCRLTSLPRPEIESAQPITTTVVSRCLCLHFADWHSNFPDVDEMINQSPRGPIVRQLAGADGSIWFDTLQAIPMITCSPARAKVQSRRPRSPEVTLSRALQYANVYQWDGEMNSNA